MSEFNVGDKVIVVGNEARFGMTKEMRNGVGVVSVSPGRDGYYGVTLDTGYFVSAKPENIYYHVEVTVYTTPPSEITLNGATYVLKEEPNPEHEWKFGDWARHPEYGVVFVGNVNGPDEIWCVIQDGDGWHHGQHVSPNNLTYISSATIPE